jgi:hypothetical protein
MESERPKESRPRNLRFTYFRAAPDQRQTYLQITPFRQHVPEHDRLSGRPVKLQKATRLCNESAWIAIIKGTETANIIFWQRDPIRYYPRARCNELFNQGDVLAVCWAIF